MTINITLATPNYIIQTSDRRMISIPDGNIYDDDANKGLVMKSDDGICSITFAGIGLHNGKRVDIWLAEKLLDEGVPELPIHQGVEVIAKLATDWFSTFPQGIDKRHIFIITGWELSKHDAIPVVWRVANCITEDGSTLESAGDAFDVLKSEVGKSNALLQASGLTGIFSRNERRRIKALLRIKSSPDKVEATLVDIIQKASHNPQWAWGINDNVLAILLTANGKARATSYSAYMRYSRYIPLLLWYERGRNYIVGDGKCSSSEDLVYQFGPLMFLAPPANNIEKQETVVDFKFRFSEAKHKSESLGHISIMRAFKKPNQSK